MPITFAAASLTEYFRESWELTGFWPSFLAALIHVALLGAFFGLPAGIFIWAERKISGRIQDRLGPTRTGGKFGWLQSLADGAKLVQKEDLVPKDADPLLFRIAPYFVVVASFMAFLFLPFADGWAAVVLDVSVFLIFAVLSIEVVGVILAGYSSGSKWALFGAMREAAQMVSYEIPLALCAVIPIVTAGTLNFMEIGHLQAGFFSNWLIFSSPFTFLGFFAFFVCATASCKRAPFDLAEAESELVAGFLTEYSGMRWSFFFLAEYASMFLVCGIAAYLFLGGWHDGLTIVDSLGLRGSVAGSYVANALGMMVFLTKASMLLCVQIWVRWTLPRLRIDQVMTTCLKYLVPISCFLFLGAVFWPLLLRAATGGATDWRTLVSGQALGDRVVRSVESARVDSASATESADGGAGPRLRLAGKPQDEVNP